MFSQTKHATQHNQYVHYFIQGTSYITTIYIATQTLYNASTWHIICTYSAILSRKHSLCDHFMCDLSLVGVNVMTKERFSRLLKELHASVTV